MKLYIAGKITGCEDYKDRFAVAEKGLVEKGHTVLSPTVLPAGFEHDDYLNICFAMIDVCDGVYLLDNWQSSPGAVAEYVYASRDGKKIFCQGN